MIDIRGTGCTGYEVAAELRASYDIYVELATHATLVLVLGIGQPVEPLERFTHDFAETVRRISRPGEASSIARPAAALEHETVVPMREAFLGRREAVAVDDAIGRISCESIAGYPPGVPSLLPGERVTAEVVAYLRELTRRGCAAARRRRPDVHDRAGARRRALSPESAGGARSGRRRSPKRLRSA